MKPRDETEADLLRQIIATPKDDAPRRVLADKLQERGDPRGEYITVECDLSAGRFGKEHGRTWDELQARSRALFRASYDEWEGPFKKLDASPIWFRGFPQILLLPHEVFVEHGAALLEWDPIHHVHFRGALAGRAAGAALAACPSLARLDNIDLADEKLDDAAAVAFAASPHLRPSVLGLGKNPIGAEGVEALVSAPWSAGLVSLDLYSTSVGVAGMEKIAGSTQLAGVRDLNLYRAGIDAGGAKALARARSLGGLRSLRLGENRIGGAGAEALAASTSFPELIELALNDNDLEDRGAIALAGATGLGAVAALALQKNYIKAAGARALAASTALRSLRDLDLSFNGLALEGVTALAEATGLPALARLGLTNVDVPTGRWESWESDADNMGGSNEVMESRSEIQARFTKRPIHVY